MAKKATKADELEIKDLEIEKDEILTPSAEEVEGGENNKIEEQIASVYKKRTLALNNHNVCSIGEYVLTLVNPVITIEADDEKHQKIIDVLIKTGKLKEIK